MALNIASCAFRKITFFRLYLKTFKKTVVTKPQDLKIQIDGRKVSWSKKCVHNESIIIKQLYI